jgi:hypothetical protein
MKTPQQWMESKGAGKQHLTLMSRQDIFKIQEDARANIVEPKYWVVSELPTHVSKPQRYLSESRIMRSAVSARDWRDYTGKKYREKGDDRYMLLVKILNTQEVKREVDIELGR